MITLGLIERRYSDPASRTEGTVSVRTLEAGPVRFEVRLYGRLPAAPVEIESAAQARALLVALKHALEIAGELAP